MQPTQMMTSAVDASRSSVSPHNPPMTRGHKDEWWCRAGQRLRAGDDVEHQEFCRFPRHEPVVWRISIEEGPSILLLMAAGGRVPVLHLLLFLASAVILEVALTNVGACAFQR